MSGSKDRTEGSQTINANGKIKRNRLLWAGLSLVAAGVVLGAVWYLWIGGYLLPRWINWKSGMYTDTAGQYEAVLSRRAVRVMYAGGEIWTSPDSVKVQDMMYCDVDGDGTDEMILLCWKRGRFGKSRPFWVEEDETAWSQHLFVYTCDRGEVRAKWMSSYIGQDVAGMRAVARKTGGRSLQGTEIVRQHLLFTDPDGTMSSFIWDSWGFTKEDTDISFVVFGDNLIHEPIYQYGLFKADGFDFLYENIRDVVEAYDVAVINQETPFAKRPSEYSGYPRFGTPVGVGEAIAAAGFDVVTCATNHALDQGVKGISFTKDFFDSHDVVCIGIQAENDGESRPYRMFVRGGAHFALLNYTYGTNGNQLPEDKEYMIHLLDDEARIRADLETARAEADCVIVFVHWGTEYEDQPDEMQRRWTQIFLESGVDVAVGTHPHVLQPYEMLRDDTGKEMLVYYSLGNFVSAQAEQSCVKGGMAQFTVSLTQDGYRISEYTLEPLEITRQGDGRYTVDVLKE